MQQPYRSQSTGQLLGPRRPHHVYLRRRLVVASALCSLLVAAGVGAGNVLANRGGDPASASTVRHNSATYLVQPGDTMWSIAEAHRGSVDLVDFVDSLIALNGGTALQIGELIALP